MRRRIRQDPIRSGGEYLNRIDRFDKAVAGRLRLDAGVLAFDSGAVERWPLDEIQALGSSSGALQLRLRGDVVLAIRFPSDSVRRWEELLREALRRHYAARGAEIVEFQPRIVTR